MKLKIWIIGITILFLFAFSIWFLYYEKTKENEIQKTEIKNNLDSLMVEHNNILKELNMQSYNKDGNIYHTRSIIEILRSKDSIIQANAIEIKQLLETKYQYGIVLKKLMRLQKITQGYVRLIDSLYTENRILKSENDSMTQTIKVVNNRNNILFKKQVELTEKIEISSYIKAYNISIQTSKLKTSSKEKITEHNVNKLSIKFDLGENKLLQCDKIIILRILHSNREIIKQVFEVNYTGESVPLNKDFIFEKPLLVGKYTVNIFDGNIIIGTQSFQIK